MQEIINLNNITLVFDDKSTLSDIAIILNETQIPFTVSTTKNQHKHFCVYISCRLSYDNKLSIINNSSSAIINLIEIIIDDIRFGLTTFLCTTIEDQQNTQLQSSGKIDIEIKTPIWQFWCEKMNSFNYRDYPLGSIN